MTSVKAMVAAYLIENGYDGLCTYECGCSIDDLMPCGECMLECKAGYDRGDGFIQLDKLENAND